MEILSQWVCLGIWRAGTDNKLEWLCMESGVELCGPCGSLPTWGVLWLLVKTCKEEEMSIVLILFFFVYCYSLYLCWIVEIFHYSEYLLIFWKDICWWSESDQSYFCERFGIYCTHFFNYRRTTSSIPHIFFLQLNVEHWILTHTFSFLLSLSFISHPLLPTTPSNCSFLSTRSFSCLTVSYLWHCIR